MIVTVTPNPSLDRTVEVESLIRGAVLRAHTATVEAGGKGVNISRALAAHGLATRAVLPSGGAEGAQLAALLAIPGVDVVLVPVAGSVRANISVVEPDGTVTKINEPGPVLSAGEIDALVAAARRAAGGSQWVAASGSLPPGTPTDFYARLIERLAPAGCRIAVDSSGEPLLRALPLGPDVVKPNREELAEAVGRAIVTLGDAVDAAERLHEKGPRSVLASLGADGAILVDASGALHGEAPVEVPLSAVGAGDALLAGFLAGGGMGPLALAEGLAWGAATASLPGSRMPGPTDLNRSAVHIHSRIDRQRRLKGAS
ncbi:MAG TPA: 1-phosphofructokinase [Actinomycetota bacterium]|nr:1-phosphofructokinase [Actinomycetota bacterium]